MDKSEVPVVVEPTQLTDEHYVGSDFMGLVGKFIAHLLHLYIDFKNLELKVLNYCQFYLDKICGKLLARAREWKH